jgi:MtN3 and saliva related transmembrane protein
MSGLTAIEAIGFAAAILTSVSSMPQVVKTLRERNVRDISLGTYAMLVVGTALWLIYGCLIKSWPMVASSSISLIPATAMLVLKIKLDKK